MELALGYKKEVTEEGKIILTKNNYEVEVIPPEGIYTLEGGTYAAFENGEYEFTVKILDTGEEIKEKVIVDELNSTDADYRVEVQDSTAFLVNSSTDLSVTFKTAWIQYKGEMINVSDCIRSLEDANYIYITGIQSKTGIPGGETVTLIIIKDGKAYSETIIMVEAV